MTDRPIIFQDWGIRAILAGTKTQTRRVIVPPNVAYPIPACPYGEPGDTLWVKETHWLGKHNDAQFAIPDVRPYTVKYSTGEWGGIESHGWFRKPENGYKKRSAMFMPRWASRIDLTLKSRRAERVQDITPDDCEAEGIEGATRSTPVRGQPYEEYKAGGLIYGTPVEAFATLWDSINTKPRPRMRGGEIAFYESFPWDGKQRTEEYRGKPWYVYPNPMVWRLEWSPYERLAKGDG